MSLPKLFFGYASYPNLLKETLSEAALKIEQTGIVTCTTWEQLPVAGTLIIDTIIEAIDKADVACFDVTTLNHNVMFELGYAIGAGKRIWLLFDSADEEAEARWKRLKLLTTTGYAPYVGSDDIRQEFLRGRADCFIGV
jgi:nucleoside 2-deoxyribosyltransferase